MKRWILSSIFTFLIFSSIFYSLDAFAAQDNSNPQALAQNMGWDAWNFGPLSVGEQYDSTLGAIFNAQFAQALGSHSAVGFIGEYGLNQYRFNGTLAHSLWTGAQAKFTTEYLSQVLPFEFDSGEMNQRVHQTAYGVELQQALQDTIFQNVSFGGYRSQAPNVSLSDVTFVQNDLYYTNQRNIAGAVAQGADIGTDVTLTAKTALNLKVNYDDVYYHTDLTGDTSQNSSRLGASASLQQILSDRLKFSLQTEQRAIDDTYRAELAWAPECGQAIGLRLSVFGQRLISSNSTPNSNTYGLNITLLSDEDTQTPNYALATQNGLENLEDWVATPAVYMQRVLAIAEQKTTLNGPNVGSINPNSGPLTGGNTVTISGSNFVSGTTVSFNGTAAEVTLLSPTSLSAVVPAFTESRSLLGDSITQTVNVVVTNPDGQSMTYQAGYTYTGTNAPIVTSISPSSSNIAGGTTVSITGTGFADATAVNFGSNSASFTINSDSNITATAPANSPGVVDITVTTPTGTSTTSSADQFTYTSPHIIFLTNSAYNGNLGGFNGADAKCNTDSAKPSSGFAENYTYKALLDGNNATSSDVSYYRTDGTTLIATATGGNLVGSSSLNNTIAITPRTLVWTGGGITAKSCSNWTSSAATSSSNGNIGISDSASPTYWDQGSATCSNSQTLYCVSQ